MTAVPPPLRTVKAYGPYSVAAQQTEAVHTLLVVGHETSAMRATSLPWDATELRATVGEMIVEVAHREGWGSLDEIHVDSTFLRAAA